MADDETEAREALARLIAAEFHDEIPDNPEDDARMDFPWRSTYEGIAVRIIADGWQHVPPGHVVVPTSGHAFEAMVERAWRAYLQEMESVYPNSRIGVDMALRAAFTASKQEPDVHQPSLSCPD